MVYKLFYIHYEIIQSPSTDKEKTELESWEIKRKAGDYLCAETA